MNSTIKADDGKNYDMDPKTKARRRDFQWGEKEIQTKLIENSLELLQSLYSRSRLLARKARSSLEWMFEYFSANL